MERFSLVRQSVIQRKKPKVKRMKNNFMEIVHNPNSSNSDNGDDNDCCEECKEYCCVTKQDCEWIKCPVCKKWILENCTGLAKTCLDCGHSILSVWLEKLKKSTKKYEGQNIFGFI